MSESKVTCERFGVRLRRLRQKASLSQRELAAKAGIEQAFLCRLENGQCEPCLGTLKTLSEAFGITLAVLLRGI